MHLAAANWLQFARALRSRPFTLLWVGQTISVFGDAVYIANGKSISAQAASLWSFDMKTGAINWIASGQVVVKSASFTGHTE